MRTHDTRTCWSPGEPEHDHEMCKDVVAEETAPDLAAGPLATITVGAQRSGMGVRLDCTQCRGVLWTAYVGGDPVSHRANLADLVEIATRHSAEHEQQDELAEQATCLGRDMDCGRPLPCPDHPVVGTRPQSSGSESDRG